MRPKNTCCTSGTCPPTCLQRPAWPLSLGLNPGLGAQNGVPAPCWVWKQICTACHRHNAHGALHHASAAHRSNTTWSRSCRRSSSAASSALPPQQTTAYWLTTRVSAACRPHAPAQGRPRDLGIWPPANQVRAFKGTCASGHGRVSSGPPRELVDQATGQPAQGRPGRSCIWPLANQHSAFQGAHASGRRPISLEHFLAVHGLGSLTPDVGVGLCLC